MRPDATAAVEVGGGPDDDVPRARWVDARQLGLDAVEMLEEVGEVAVLGVGQRRLVEIDLGKRLVEHREHEARAAPHEAVEAHAPVEDLSR